MSPRQTLFFARYGLAALSVVLGGILRLELDRSLGASPPVLFLFVVPVMISAWYGGFGPGLLAAAVGGAVDFVFFNPRGGAPSAPSSVDLLRLALFLSTGLAVSYLGAKLREAQERVSAGVVALREGEARLRLALGAANAVVWDWEIAADRVRVSGDLHPSAGIAAAGAPAGRASLEGWLCHVHAEDRPEVAARLRSMAGQEAEVDVEYRVRGAEDPPRWLNLRGQGARGAGRVTGVILDVTERKRREVLLRALSARLQSAREEEAARIAREIHDELGASLTGIRWELEWLEGRLTGRDDREFAGLGRRVADVIALVNGMIATVRRISSELRPAVLEDLGLIAAIEWQARHFQARTGIPVVVSAPDRIAAVPRETEVALFRILQEALTNVLRHSGASRVGVRVEHSGGSLLLNVDDDGRGIAAGRLGAGTLGLAGMRERAGLVGGTVRIGPGARGGTRVEARVPAPDAHGGGPPPASEAPAVTARAG